MSLLNQDSVTNYWWDCPSCGTTKISSIAHHEHGDVAGAQMCCPECFYVMRGDEHSYVDNDIYEVPSEWVDRLQTPRWKCQECGGLNEKPDDKELGELTVDDLYCKHCDTWQCDIEGTPGYDPDAQLRREAKSIAAKTRWENPIEPVELKDDRAEFEKKYNYKNQKTFTLPEIPKPNRTAALALAGLVAASSVSGIAYDGLRTRTMDATITSPQAVVTQEIQEYEIVTREGWSPSRTAPDFRLVSQEIRQNGTRQVPDGLETYFETEQYLARTDTQTYTVSESYQVQSGSRQECSSTKVGATSQQSCRSVPTYSTESRPVTKTRSVPVYASRQVSKTRQKFRTEPVMATYYRWQEGIWEHEETLQRVSNDFDVDYPDASQYQNESDIRVLSPQAKCSVELVPTSDRLDRVRKDIGCDRYQQLEDGDTGVVTYSKWTGVKSIETKE